MEILYSFTFVKKGKIDDYNNYRGISLLSPVAKIFETLLADQVGDYFEKNNLFHPCQHGFIGKTIPVKLAYTK